MINQQAVYDVIADRALSAKGIAAELGEYGPTSETLRAIEEACWDMVSVSELVAIDRRDDGAALFFQRA